MTALRWLVGWCAAAGSDATIVTGVAQTANVPSQSSAALSVSHCAFGLQKMASVPLTYMGPLWAGCSDYTVLYITTFFAPTRTIWRLQRVQARGDPS